jgi:hypothetical protein
MRGWLSPLEGVHVRGVHDEQARQLLRVVGRDGPRRSPAPVVADEHDRPAQHIDERGDVRHQPVQVVVLDGLGLVRGVVAPLVRRHGPVALRSEQPHHRLPRARVLREAMQQQHRRAVRRPLAAQVEPDLGQLQAS